MKSWLIWKIFRLKSLTNNNHCFNTPYHATILVLPNLGEKFLFCSKCAWTICPSWNKLGFFVCFLVLCKPLLVLFVLMTLFSVSFSIFCTTNMYMSFGDCNHQQHQETTTFLIPLTTLVSFVVLHKTSREELNGLCCYIVMMQSALAFLFERTIILFLENMSDTLWHFNNIQAKTPEIFVGNQMKWTILVWFEGGPLWPVLLVEKKCPSICILTNLFSLQKIAPFCILLIHVW